MAAGLRVYADSGYSQVQVWLNQTSVEGIEAFAPVLELVRRKMVDLHVRSGGGGGFTASGVTPSARG